MNGHSSSGKSEIHVGTSLVLVIFVALCLVTFATLSYVTARADYSKSQEAASSEQEYYAAVSHIEEQLAELNASDYEVGDELTFTEEIHENRFLEATIMVIEEDGIKCFKTLKWAECGEIQRDDASEMKLIF